MLGRYVTGQIKRDARRTVGPGRASERYVISPWRAAGDTGNVIGSGSGPGVVGRKREQAPAVVEMVKRAWGRDRGSERQVTGLRGYVTRFDENTFLLCSNSSVRMR